MSQKINKQFYKFFAALAIYVVGVVAASLYLFMDSQKMIMERCRRELAAAAYETANDLGEDFHDRTIDQDSISAEENIKNTKKLTNLAKVLRVQHIYTVVKDDHGNIRISSSSLSDDLLNHNKRPLEYFACYKTAPDVLKKAFETEKIAYYETNTFHGKCYSVFIPLKSAAGRTYMACAEINLADISFSLLKVLYKALFLAGFLLLLAAPMLMAFNDYQKTQGGELKEKQKQLAHAGRLTAMGEMAAGIAHEINQPLCVIRGYLELMKSVLKDSHDIKKQNLQNAFDISIKSVERASGIINHMRSFVRVKSKEAQPTNLSEPTDNALSFFNEQIRLHNISLEKDYQADTPKVLLEAQRFEQIAVNFISNARYAVDKKGEELGREFKKQIKIGIYYDARIDKVVFEISDNGIGMSKDVLKKCIKPFFTTKDVEEGTGLGLSIVHDIVTGFGGDLEIKSQKGQGASFKAVFPPVKE
jgi:signal transduction histidine kinase